MRKRANGEGSIYFVEGRGYRANVVVGRTPDGSLDRKSKTFELRAEASRWLKAQLNNKDKGIIAAPDRLTVAQYAKEWMRDVIEPNNSPNTYEFYDWPLRAHIIPAIGSIPLTALRREHIIKMLNDRRAKYRPRSIKAFHQTISAILNHAVEGRLLEYNVAALVKTKDKKHITEEQLVVPMSSEQTARLLAVIEEHPWRCFVTLALLLGIRRGELVALRWRDIDLVGGWVKIRFSMIRINTKRLKEQPTSRFSGKGSRLAPLKNPKHKRDLELPPVLRDVLLTHKAQQDAQRMKAGDKWREEDWVFTSDHGAHFHPDTATGLFPDLRLLADLPVEISLHDLRHAFASAMLSKGVNPKLVQLQLGHTKIQTTLDIYSHLMPGERTGLSDVMGAFIAEGRKKLEATRAAAGEFSVRLQ